MLSGPARRARRESAWPRALWRRRRTTSGARCPEGRRELGRFDPKEGGMRSKQAYCAARDQEIRIAWPEAPLHPGQAMVAEAADAVCLDLGERCTGELCPT